MKADAIEKALAQLDGRGMATDALTNTPVAGKPTDLPETPDIEANGPPETTPVETGGAPEFHDLTGLPIIAMESAPEEFPADAAEDGEAGDVLDFIF